MGDSDDEYSSFKRNRDKFYREREEPNGNSSRNERREERKDPWKNKLNVPNQNYQYHSQLMYNNPRTAIPDFQRRYNPANFDSSPPHKKNKKEWENVDSSHGQYSLLDSNNQYTYSQNEFLNHEDNRDIEYPTQPPYLSFKQFLQQQDDTISEEDAIKKYNQYKIEFKKIQINEFFIAHKEEDWFKARYHPDESFKRFDEQKRAVDKRLNVFMDLFKKGWLDNVFVEIDGSARLVRFLDGAIIKMEGGNDCDLKVLDSESKENLNNQSLAESLRKENKIKKSYNNSLDNQGTKQKTESDSESGAYSESDEDGHENNKKQKIQQETNIHDGKSSIPLHRTTSIFLRNLPPSITKEELESIFKELNVFYSGFKRIALSEPTPERNFFRRGWVTFNPTVNIKDICWLLNNRKIRGFNPSAMVNKDLNKRIRPISNAICHHKLSMKNDIKIATKIIEHFDRRWNLWTDESKNKSFQTDDSNNRIGDAVFKGDHVGNSTNPLLCNISDYLVDEMNAEEEELLGKDSKEANIAKEATLEIDLDYKKTLDRLILYLRVVHSFDFYNSTEYQQEDSMPNRCGIIHARTSLLLCDQPITFKMEDINAYIAQFEFKMKPYTEYKDRLDDDTARKLGLKDKEIEVEKFVQTNTQELAPDRWLCPLSGKKFKGPEFIRKHLFYKHEDKINEVKKEVDYFNNYLLDPKRPQLPEHPSNKNSNLSYQQPFVSSSSTQQSSQLFVPSIKTITSSNNTSCSLLSADVYYNSKGSRPWEQPFHHNPLNGSSRMPHSNMNSSNPTFSRNLLSNSGSRRPRDIINYKDLDAPDEC